jgi:hypothetical protein
VAVEEELPAQVDTTAQNTLALKELAVWVEEELLAIMEFILVAVELTLVAVEVVAEVLHGLLQQEVQA